MLHTHEVSSSNLLGPTLIRGSAPNVPCGSLLPYVAARNIPAPPVALRRDFPEGSAPLPFDLKYGSDSLEVDAEDGLGNLREFFLRSFDMQCVLNMGKAFTRGKRSSRR